MPAFDEWFSQTSGHSDPRPWQARLSSEETCRSRLIRIPTGQGKTLGVLASWAWHRLERQNQDWPRRLVWVLPMRVLTEQTMAEAQRFLKAAGYADVGVHQLMGGADAGEWHLHPERETVLIGTQDMLLSRALNRGYASGRARWPMDFGLLSQDALWVFDEVQLMDVALATSAQLQAFRDDEVDKHLRPVHSWWMSATLQPEWLHSVDTAAHHGEWSREPISVSIDELTSGPTQVAKPMSVATIDADDHGQLASRVLDEHTNLEDGDHGRITLVVCNTVDRARDLHAALIAAGRHAEDTHLVHSRFRPADREDWTSFLRREACTHGVDRIIVATQVVEAGVDISAGCLVTELAPWPSLVQRFGRCARYGGSGRVLIVDRANDERMAAPYEPDQLASARRALEQLDDVAIAKLEAFEAELAPGSLQELYPYAPKHLLLRREYDELFDTTPDLTGADLDIARFIRSGDDRDCLICWEEWPDKESPSAELQPIQRALCRVSVHRARQWLKSAKIQDLADPHVFDYLTDAWRRARVHQLRPGQIVLVRCRAGGYDQQRGFTGEPPKKSTPPVPIVVSPSLPADLRTDQAQDREDLSATTDRRIYQTIATHGRQVALEVSKVIEACRLSDHWSRLFDLAARLHDWGKAHPAFTSNITAGDKPCRPDLAKAPDDAWKPLPQLYETEDGRRRGFRHELASVLACFELLARHDQHHQALLGTLADIIELGVLHPEPIPPQTGCVIADELAALAADDFDLVAYLIASHHGKLRASWHASPHDQDFESRTPDDRGLPLRGIRQGDALPEIPLCTEDGTATPVPALDLHLAPAALGLNARYGRSWRERTLAMQQKYGPAALAWLESLLRAADIRASRDPITDDLIQEVPA